MTVWCSKYDIVLCVSRAGRPQWLQWLRKPPWYRGEPAVRASMESDGLYWFSVWPAPGCTSPGPASPPWPDQGPGTGGWSLVSSVSSHVLCLSVCLSISPGWSSNWSCGAGRGRAWLRQVPAMLSSQLQWDWSQLQSVTDWSLRSVRTLQDHRMTARVKIIKVLQLSPAVSELELRCCQLVRVTHWQHRIPGPS